MTAYSELSSSRTVQADGFTVHYHDVGEGTPLIILQPFGPLPGTTSWLTYHQILADLTPKFRCILIDYPNFGRSSPVVFHEPVHNLYVRAVAGVLEELSLDEVTVLGLSTGGTVALNMALTMPERINKLIVGGCTASTGGDPYILTPTPTEVSRLFDENQTDPPNREKIARLARAMVHDSGLISSEIIDAMYDLRVQEPQHSKAWSQSKSIPHSNIEALPTIQIPTLIVHGRFDRMVPLEQALVLLAYIPSADLVVLNNCGHWVPFERPHDFVRSIMTFLTN